MQPFEVTSGQGTYRVEFHDELQGLIQAVGEIQRPVLLVDENVADLYASRLEPLASSIPTLKIPAAESEKTLEGIGRVVSFLQQVNVTKQTTVLAIGGGIIQDITTFTSHVYYRGVRWVFAPTTLLSMSDSCIGAKCGINAGAFKNQLGVFHSPSRVLICTRFLETLSENDIRSGCGEILKLLLTGSAEQFERFRASLDVFGFRNPDMDRFVYESLLVKKEVIEEDEYETDLRRILNYGHTFGHALEALTDFSVPHGIAVAWGLDLVNYIALKRGILEKESFDAVHDLVERHFAFRVSRMPDARQLVDGTRRDKKVADGKLMLAILERPGRLKIFPVAFDAILEDDVSEYIESSRVLRRD